MPRTGGLEEAAGPVRAVDPVDHALTVHVGQETATFRIADGARVEVNGRTADSSELRRGQAASVRFARPNGDGAEVAAAVVARDRPQPERINGTIEAIDLDRGTITLYSPNGRYRSFELDPHEATVRVDGEVADVGELEIGQRVSLQSIPKVVSIRSDGRSAGSRA